MQRLNRLSSILVKLQSRQLITAPQLSDHFGVSIRTIYRDVKALVDSGVPIIVIEGKGYRLMDGFTLPPVTFSEEEAYALVTASNIIARNKDSSLVKNHKEAIDKIIAVMRAVDKSKAEQLLQRITVMHNLSGYRSSENLSDIQKAITNNHTIEIEYLSKSKDEHTSRIIEPLALYLTRENWVLIAYCRLRKANREFRLDQMSRYRWTGEYFEDTAFDLLKYFQSFMNP